MEVCGQLHDASRFTTKERAPGTQWVGGWVGPSAGLDAVVKRKIPSHCRDSVTHTIEIHTNQNCPYRKSVIATSWGNVTWVTISLSRMTLFHGVSQLVSQSVSQSVWKQWWAILNTNEHSGSIKGEEFFDWVIINFSRTLLHEVS
jgi:hypothetical protein